MQRNIILYSNDIEEALSKIQPCIKADYGLSKRAVALLLLQRDEEMLEQVKKDDNEGFLIIKDIIDQYYKTHNESAVFSISSAQQELCKKILEDAIICEKNHRNVSTLLNKITINPFTGIPLLLLVLYFGLYKFVGEFGSGTLVDFIESKIFDEYINPYINSFFNTLIPWKVVNDLLVNEYGIFTLGIKYAVAIVLPIVGCFFIMFSIIEDSGYLPRISLLMDKAFKIIGLNGRAVIPMTLGFGCDTMATMVSRTLETRRERIISTFLLALAIPCSAQLGVIMSLLSEKPGALAIWVVFMIFVFMLVGYLTSKLLPGERPGFYMELPPLRLPRLSNVLKKTYTRMYWYFREILPLFIFASVLIWFGNLTGLFEFIVAGLKPVVNALGLPDETAKVFLFGFFRRDYGAAGLFDMQTSGIMNGRQLVVASATLTLFVPCVAQFAMMVKERGLKTALAMGAFIIPFAFASGYILNKILILWGINLG